MNKCFNRTSFLLVFWSDETLDGRNLRHGRQFESRRVKFSPLRAVGPVERSLLARDRKKGHEGREKDNDKAHGRWADNHGQVLGLKVDVNFVGKTLKVEKWVESYFFMGQRKNKTKTQSYKASFDTANAKF